MKKFYRLITSIIFLVVSIPSFKVFNYYLDFLLEKCIKAVSDTKIKEIPAIK